MQLESSFIEKRQKLSGNYSTCQVSNHGKLTAIISELEPNIAIRHIGDYRFQTIYELTRKKWLII